MKIFVLLWNDTINRVEVGKKPKGVSKMNMNRVEVGRYESSVGFKGWVATNEWILFESDNGEVSVYHRDETGAVVNEPAVLK